MPLRRRETTAVERAEAELRDRETRRAELAGEIERAELDVAEKHAAVQAAEGAELAAYATRDDRGEAKRRREDAERELEAARAELDRLRRYQVGLEEYVEEARAAVRAAQRDDAERRYEDALAERNEAVAAFTSSPSLTTLEEVERKRAQADEARERLAELQVGTWPSIPAEDEPAFPEGSDRVAEALAAGPRRPLETTAAKIAELARERRSTDYSMLLQIARTGSVPAGAHERLGDKADRAWELGKQFIEERRAMQRAARESLEKRGAQRDHETVEAEYDRIGRPEPLEDRVRALLDEAVAA